MTQSINITDLGVPVARKDVIVQADMAGNADYTLAVPAGQRYKLLSVMVTLDTDANAGNRFVTLRALNGAQVKMENVGAVIIVNELLSRWFSEAFAGLTGVVYNGFTGAILDPGESLVVDVVGGLAGDRYTVVAEVLVLVR